MVKIGLWRLLNMKEMLKKFLKNFLKIVYVLIILFFAYTNEISAVEDDNNSDLDNLEDFYYETGIDDIISKYLDIQTTEEIKGIFDVNRYTGKDVDKNMILSFSPLKMLRMVFGKVKNEAKNMIKNFFVIVAVVLISGILEFFKICFSNKSINEVFNCVCVLCIFMCLCSPIIECVRYSADVIVNMSDFMVSFMPVCVGVMSTCGLAMTAGVYNIFMLSVCQIFSQILSEKLLPVVGVYLAFCLVGAMSPEFNISKAAKEIKNVVTWVFVFLVTSFTGLITIQGVVSSGADTVGTKTAKFFIGSAIPVIGSAISDAYTSVKGCFNFIRSGVGVIIIIFIVVLFLPVLIKLAIWFLTTKLSASLADFLGTNQVSDILKSSGEAIGLLLAVVVSYILLVVISTTVILILGMNLS